jgi:hypothetical protein
MDTATINGITYHLVPVEGQSQHKAGEPFNDEWEYAGELRVPSTVDVFVDLYGRPNPSYLGKQGLICADSVGYLREILRPRQKPALLPPDSTYWVQTIFGIDSFLSWEDKPRSINIRAVDDPHSYVWHPDGNNWLDRVLSKAYDWHTLHIAPKGYFDGEG